RRTAADSSAPRPDYSLARFRPARAIRLWLPRIEPPRASSASLPAPGGAVARRAAVLQAQSRRRLLSQTDWRKSSESGGIFPRHFTALRTSAQLRCRGLLSP